MPAEAFGRIRPRSGEQPPHDRPAKQRPLQQLVAESAPRLDPFAEQPHPLNVRKCPIDAPVRSLVACPSSRRSCGKAAVSGKGLLGSPEKRYMTQWMGAMNVEWSLSWRQKPRHTLPRRCTWVVQTAKIPRTANLR